MDRALNNNEQGFIRKENFIFFLDNINFSYQQRLALEAIHLSVEQSQIVYLTGASGAGKSTLIKILAGINRPRSGKFISPRPDQHIVYLQQEVCHLVNQSLIENLELSYTQDHYGNYRQFLESAKELLSYFNLQSRLKEKIEYFSGGERQQIALVRSLLAAREILLADEPTSSMDSESAFKAFELMNYFNIKKKLTMIIATHNRELIKQLSGQVYHLDKGRIVFKGRTCFS